MRRYITCTKVSVIELARTIRYTAHNIAQKIEILLYAEYRYSFYRTGGSVVVNYPVDLKD